MRLRSSWWIRGARPLLRTLKKRLFWKQSISVYWSQDFDRLGLTSSFLDFVVQSGPHHMTVNDPLNSAVVHAHSFSSRAVAFLRNARASATNGITFLKGHRVSETYSGGAPLSKWCPPPLFGMGSRIDGPAIAIPRTSWNFYHWLVESLPTVLRSRTLRDDIVVLVDRRAPSYVTEALNMLQIECVQRRGMQIVGELVLPVGGSDGAWPHPQDVRLTRDEILALTTGTPAGPSRTLRLYVSRRFSTRALDNELELEERLSDLGFSTVFPERMSLGEQIDLFQKADVVVGNHGAGLTNILFCPRDTRVIEVASRHNPNYCFENLARVIGQPYRRIFSEPGNLFDRHSLSASAMGELLESVRGD